MYRCYPDELYHYGILGMKWGVRRYQNPDGTRTALGKERERKGDGGYKTGGRSSTLEKMHPKNLGKGGLKEVGKKAAKGAAVVGGIVAANRVGHVVANDEKQANKLNQQVTSTGNMIDKYESKKKAKKRYEERAKRRTEAQKMSDDELQKRVRRLNLEKQYLDLSDDRTDDGSWSTKDKIEVGQQAVNWALTLGGLYLSYKGLKGR